MARILSGVGSLLMPVTLPVCIGYLPVISAALEGVHIGPT